MLIDTSGFLCRFGKAEIYHKEAVRFYDSATVRFTTNYILAEYTALAQIRGVRRTQIIEFSKRILDDSDVNLIWVEEALHSQAVQLLFERQDKAYSLCDAVSFLIMRAHGLTEALTTDRHFKQEGFVRLLEP